MQRGPLGYTAEYVSDVQCNELRDTRAAYSYRWTLIFSRLDNIAHVVVLFAKRFWALEDRGGRGALVASCMASRTMPGVNKSGFHRRGPDTA